ncbi:MAG: HIT family protein [bacterium]
MKQLWAPWRSEYLSYATRKCQSCLFCYLKRQKDDKKNLILYRGKLVLVVMNRYPYNAGHLMVAPLRHVASFEGLKPDEGVELMALLKMSLRCLRQEFKPRGFNVGANLGAVAGAGVTGHLHLHIVPRWQGDTNFMPLFTETKVISEHLDKSYERLIRRFRRIELR